MFLDYIGVQFALAIYPFILLTKQMGLVFFIVAVFLLLGMCVVRMDGEKCKFVFAKTMVVDMLLRVAFFICVPVSFSGIWQHYVKSVYSSESFSISRAFQGIVDFIWQRNMQGYQGDTVYAFTHAVFQEPISYIGISFVAWGICLVFISILLIRFYRYYFTVHVANCAKVLYSCLFMGALLYVAVLLVLYITVFSPYEATHLASFSRYIETYVFAAVLVCVYMIINVAVAGIVSFSNTISKRYRYLLFFSCFFVFGFFSMVWMQQVNLGKIYLRPAYETENVRELREQANKISACMSRDARLFMIIQEDNGDVFAKMNYYLIPNKVWWISVGTPRQGDVWMKKITPEELVKEISQYDFVYFYNLNDEFIEKYAPYLHIVPESGQMYKVEKSIGDEDGIYCLSLLMNAR